MKTKEALEDINYIKSLCKDARESLYAWNPFILLFSVIWLVGMLIPLIPGITTKFSLDGKHWPLLFVIGLIGTWVIKKRTKLIRVPFMMKILIWNWAVLFLFAVAVLFWNTDGYYASEMYNYWIMVVGVAFMMAGVTLQARIGWIGVGFLLISFISDTMIFRIFISFEPLHHVEAPVMLVKAALGGLLLGLSWWMIRPKKAGVSVG